MVATITRTTNGHATRVRAARDSSGYDRCISERGPGNNRDRDGGDRARRTGAALAGTVGQYRSLVVTRLLFEHDRVLAIAARTQDGRVTGANALARIDAANDRVLTVTQLPPGQLLAAFGAGSLWVARVNGSTVERIDPATGATANRIRAHLGTTLTFGGGRLWTTDRNGTLRQLVGA